MNYFYKLRDIIDAEGNFKYIGNVDLYRVAEALVVKTLKHDAAPIPLSALAYGTASTIQILANTYGLDLKKINRHNVVFSVKLSTTKTNQNSDTCLPIPFVQKMRKEIGQYDKTHKAMNHARFSSWVNYHTDIMGIAAIVGAALDLGLGASDFNFDMPQTYILSTLCALGLISAAGRLYHARSMKQAEQAIASHIITDWISDAGIAGRWSAALEYRHYQYQEVTWQHMRNNPGRINDVGRQSPERIEKFVADHLLEPRRKRDRGIILEMHPQRPQDDALCLRLHIDPA